MKNIIGRLAQSPLVLIVVLLLPLIAFFVYAWYFENSFFTLLAAAMAICVGYLIFAYFNLSDRKAIIDLEGGEQEEQLNLAQAEINRDEKANHSLREKIAGFALLKDLTEKLCASFSVSDTSNVIAQEVNGLYNQPQMTVVVYYLKPKVNHLSLITSLAQNQSINLKAKQGDLYDQWVLKNLKPLLVEDTKSDFRFDPERVQTEDGRAIGSLISVPLAVGEKMVGILRVDSSREHHFTTEDLRFLNTVGSLGAVALENAQLYERVEDLAIRDSLTGVFLRRHLLERMTNEIGRHLRSKSDLSFLMIDLDHFKRYNDQFGHTAGDIVLKNVATILTQMFDQPGQIVSRYGGEEFCVLLPDCPKKKAGQLAEEIRKRIEMKTVVLRREKTKITVSIGVATFPKDAANREELVQKADGALYKAKNKGRNQVANA